MWVLLPGLWSGACSDRVNNLGRFEATGGASTPSGTGGGTTAGSAGSGTCGGRVCPTGDICCGPPECGFCNTPGTNVYCPTTCGSGGNPGSAAAGGAPGGGGSAACPVGLPSSSSSCSAEGLNCYYSGCSGAATYCSAIASCTSGNWSIGYTDCLCPSSGGASSAGGGAAIGGAGGAGGASCTRYPTDDAHCSTMGYPPYAYFCQVPAQRPDPTCVIYNGIGSGDFYCCP